MKTKIIVPSIITALLFFSPTIVSAIPVVYTVAGVGSGELGGEALNNASFDITSTADTSQIEFLNPGLYLVDDLITTISISGLGTATFVSPLVSIDTQGLSRAGDRNSIGSLPVLSVNNPIFASYNLASAIGPVSGTPSFTADTDYATTDGNFSLSSVSSATFQANVPDRASTLGLPGLAVFALDIFRRWHREILPANVTEL